MENNTALCLFGSAARNTMDKYSDKDLLVVSDNFDSIPDEVKKSWKEQGWSPAYYNWNSLLQKAVRGDLFIQNLKLEGVMVDDPTDQLSRLLSDFSPRPDYTDEITKSIIMLRVADRRPENIWLSQMMCEVTHRFFRHAMLHALASKQIYIFDYIESVNVFSAEISPLTDLDKQMLHDARVVQFAYKNKKVSDLDALELLRQMKETLTRIFEFEFLDIPADAPVRSLKKYSTLRDIEARILAYHEPLKMDEGEILPDIWKLLKDPYRQNWAPKGKINQEVLDSINTAIDHSKPL